VNKQFESKKIKINIVKAIIDATITKTPFCLKGKTVYNVVEDRIEEDNGYNAEINSNDSVLLLIKVMFKLG